MSRDKKSFFIGAVLTVVGNKLVCEVAQVYEIMSFLLGQSIYTHQLITYHDICKAAVLSQHPALSDYDDSACNLENWKSFLKEQATKYGDILDLHPIENVPVLDPMKDLLDLVPAEKVVVVAAERKGKASE